MTNDELEINTLSAPASPVLPLLNQPQPPQFRSTALLESLLFLVAVTLTQLGVLVALAVQASCQSTTMAPMPTLSTALASLVLNLQNLESSVLASISTVPDTGQLPQNWNSQVSSMTSMQ